MSSSRTRRPARWAAAAAALVVALSLLPAQAASAAPPPNILPNASFESVTAGALQSWSSGSVGTGATFTSDDSVAFDRSRSARIDVTSGQQWVIQKFSIPVVEGEVYQVGAQARTELDAGVPRVNAYLRSASALVATQTFAGSSGTTEWAYVGGLVQIPAGVTTVTYELAVWSASGTVWWDAAEFFKVDQKLPNGAFTDWSAGKPDGWSAGNVGGTGTATLAKDTSIAFAGSSARVTAAASGDRYLIQKFYVPVIPGDRVAYSVMQRAQSWSGTAPAMNVYYYDASHTYLSKVSFTGTGGTHAFEHVGGESVVPSAARFATVELQAQGGTGQVWWDAATMATVLHAPRDLGVATHSSLALNAIPLDGDRLLALGMTSVANGGMRMAVVDAVSAHKQAEFSLTATPNGTGQAGSWSSAKGADGNVYFGTLGGGGREARLFRFDPAGPSQPVDLGKPVAGETYVFSLTPGKNAAGHDGVYGGTFPNGHLFFHDFVTGTTTDHGQVASGVSYVRGLGTAPNGLIYMGTGTPARVFVFDPATSTKTELSLPAPYDSGDYAFSYYVHELDEKIIVTLTQNSGPPASLIFDPANLSAAPVTAAVAMEGPIVAYDSSDPGKAYVLNNGVFDYDLSTNTSVTLVSEPLREVIMGSPSMVELGKSGYPGESIAGITIRGKVWHFNPQTGEQEFVELNDGGTPAEETPLTSDGLGIDSLQYLNGKVYGGAYINQMLFAHDVASGQRQDLGQPIRNGGEIYSMAALDGKLYLGSYTEAVISVYDPTQTWNPGTSTGSNPRTIGSLASPQYRPYSMTAGSDGRIYIGSEAGYGQKGGALSVLDPTTGTIEELHRFSPTASASEGVSALDSANGKVYLGTTVGNFYVYDIASDTIGAANTVGPTLVSSVRVAPSGTVYAGNTSGTVKMFTPGSGFTFSAQAVPDVVRGMIIGKDGNLYVIGLNSLVRITTHDNVSKTLFAEGNGPADGFSFYNTITLDPGTGTIYYGASERLKAFTP